MANKSEVKKGLDVGRVLVYGAAMFQAYHMGRAFFVYDPHGWSFGSVNFGGLLLGAILNVIVAQAALRLPSLSATFESRKQLLPKVGKQADKQALKAHAKALKEMTLAGVQSRYSVRGFYVLLAFSVLMVAPALYIIWTASLGALLHPFFIGVMAVVGAVAPDVAITVGGFIADEKGSAVSGQQHASKGDKPRKQGDKLQGASSKQGVQVAGAISDKLQVQGDKQVRKQPVQDAALLAYWQSNPKASDGQVAQEFKMSRQAIQQRREKLIARGEIKMTENGVAFLSIGVNLNSEVRQ
jgi:hypothetical protein